MTVAADAAVWIGIAVTAGGILVGAIVALWVGLPGFRLEPEATIDAKRQAIRLDVENKGRASGWVTEVVLVDDRGIEHDAEFAGLDQGRFKPTEIPARWSGWLILAADKAKGPFDPDLKVLMRWGHDEKRTLVPKVVTNVGYYGLESQWP